MPSTNYENLKLYFLQEYHRHGLPARMAVVKFFLEQLQENLDKYIPNKSDKELEFDLNNKQKLSLLQIGTISHLMLLIEDIATIFTAFKSGEWDYYKYLDKKEEDDLGAIIGKFYSNIDDLKDDEIRFILGYIDPKNLQNSTESEKDFLRSIIKKNIHSMRYFLIKANVFWGSHINVFRRYKHAGFPIMLGLNVPENDFVLGEKFDFVSLVSTAKGDLAEEVTIIPFSKKSIESYQTFLEEIFVILFFVIESNLIKIERDLEGVIPNPNESFSKRLTKNERKKLRKIYGAFMNSNQPHQSEFHAQANPQGVYPTWYVHLDTYSKSSIDLAIEKESAKKT